MMNTGTALRKSQDRMTYQRLPTDGLDETVHDFRDQLGTDFGASNNCGITAHAGFPVGALLCHCRGDVCGTYVILVLKSTERDLLYYICFKIRDSLVEPDLENSENVPIEYSDTRCSTSRCTVKINWTTRYRNSRIREKLKKN